MICHVAFICQWCSLSLWIYDINVLKGYQVIYGCVYACSCVTVVVCFAFECKYIIMVNTYQSFGVHLFSTVFVHVIYLYRKHAGTSQPSEVPVFFMIGFSTHTINQIKGSHALISGPENSFHQKPWDPSRNPFPPLEFSLGRSFRGCNWHEFQEARFEWETGDMFENSFPIFFFRKRPD